jgi:diguanylate cyclase (GGDEF)-like protein
VIDQQVVGYQSSPAPAPGRSWIVIPPISVPADAVGIALLVAVAALPLLVGIGLIILGRVWGTALSMRNSRLRMALASELELSPRELAALSPSGLLKLRDQVAFDELTGALRRAAGIAAAEREVARARRSHSPLSAVFVDLDGLKRVNDTKGHEAGDAFIRGVATMLRESLRGQDLVFRYGGDEFVCLLPGVGEEIVVDKFHQLRLQALEKGTRFSFGVAELGPHEDLVSFLGRADHRLYAQRSDRNRSVAGGPIVPIPAHGKGHRSPRRRST